MCFLCTRTVLHNGSTSGFLLAGTNDAEKMRKALVNTSKAVGAVVKMMGNPYKRVACAVMGGVNERLNLLFMLAAEDTKGGKCNAGGEKVTSVQRCEKFVSLDESRRSSTNSLL